MELEPWLNQEVIAHSRRLCLAGTNDQKELCPVKQRHHPWCSPSKPYRMRTGLSHSNTAGSWVSGLHTAPKGLVSMQRNTKATPEPSFCSNPSFLHFDLNAPWCWLSISSTHSLGTARTPTATPGTWAAAARLVRSFPPKKQWQQLLSLLTHPVCMEEFKTTVTNSTVTFTVTGTGG